VDWWILEMFKDLFFCIIFSVLINWSMGMQILNQVSKNKNVKIISSAVALMSAFAAGYIIILGL
jgi:hypothetical protein